MLSKNTAGIANIPTIGFGPGEEEQAHTPNEHLTIDQLVTSAKGYAALALELFKIKIKKREVFVRIAFYQPESLEVPAVFFSVA